LILAIGSAIGFTALPAHADYQQYTYDASCGNNGITTADGRLWSANNVSGHGPGWLQLEDYTSACNYKNANQIYAREDLLFWNGSQWVWCNTGPMVYNNASALYVLTGWTVFRPCGSGFYYLAGYNGVWTGSKWDQIQLHTPYVNSEY